LHFHECSFEFFFHVLPQNFENPIIVCNEEHRFIVASQLQEIEVIPQKIILEPCARNTASAIAVAKGCGFVPIRKKGKLPFSTYSKQYGLEYGVDEIEIHTDAFEPGSKVLLVDDVLATGGTLVAAIELVKQAGGIVTDIAVLSEITFLGGRLRIAQHSPEVSVHALISG
jgi:adenine phosphoribosyltransferase